MLAFETDNKPKIPVAELEKMHIADVLHDERDFKIVVDGQTMLYIQHFPVWELAQYCLKWIKKPKKDFIYNTIESEENPLIAFRKLKYGWKIESVWQKFECKRLFSDNDVINFARELLYQVTY